MPYRDQAHPCPHCGVELVRYDGRDKWRCGSCAGVLVGENQLAVEIGQHGRDWLLDALSSTTPGVRPCPGCKQPMTPFVLQGFEIDRCVADGLVWFDAGELGRARTVVASSHADEPFVVQIVDTMFPKP